MNFNDKEKEYLLPLLSGRIDDLREELGEGETNEELTYLTTSLEKIEKN